VRRETRPVTPDLLSDPVQNENLVREQISEMLVFRKSRAPSSAKFDELTRLAVTRPPFRGAECFDTKLLSCIPMIAIESRGPVLPFTSLGTDVADVVATTTPPLN
jgi:hypothetical protein